jgi:preprotein translocase subunit SecY
MIVEKIKSILHIKYLREKIIATLLLVLIYKVFSIIPIPGVNTDGLAAVMDQQK